MLTTVVLLVALTLGQQTAEKPPQAQPPAPGAKPPAQSPPAQPPATAPKPAAPTTPAPATAAPRPAAPAARPSITVMVTDRRGRPLPDVTVKATGPMEREDKTDAEGTVLLRNVAVGTYRLRFESAETVTFEREVVVAAGRPVKTTAELTAAPPPPPPPPAPEPPPPAPAPPPVRPSGPPSSVDIPEFYEKNSIGRGAASKNSPVGCTGTATATLIQLRDPLAEHSHAEADEMFYVVAGAGVQRIGGAEMSLTAGTFAVVPRGTPHSITRRGNNPILVLSILTGPPCDAPK